MKIDKEVKDFLSENKDLINAFDFTTLYELARKKGYANRISEMTYVFYHSGIDPLEYMKSVPDSFAIHLDLPDTVIYIPDQIKHIYPYAFADINATKIIAPANLKSTPLSKKRLSFENNAAFAHCKDLIEIDFSKCHSYEKIGKGLLEQCPNLKIIKFPENLRIIRTGAFAECKSLTSIDLSKCHKLTDIEYHAFGLCENLTTIYLPNSIKYIEFAAFDTGKPIIIKFDGTQQEWDEKFGEEIIKGNWNTSTIDIQYLR